MFQLHTDYSNAEAKRRSIELLEHVGILPGADRYNQYPFELSGGMLQRASIAMSLACNPRLLIADEPTTALDVTMQVQILELLKRLQKELQSSILLITHNFGVIAEFCDRVSVMYAGQIVETGDVREIFHKPCHPYTRDLINSIPKSGARGTDLVSIPGAPPQLNQPIIGCSYAPRCGKANERCFRKPPETKKISDSHEYVCYLDDDGYMNDEVSL